MSLLVVRKTSLKYIFKEGWNKSVLKSYIKEILEKMEASEDQKELVLDMLQNIKKNETLFSEFQNVEEINFPEDEQTILYEQATELILDPALEKTIISDVESGDTLVFGTSENTFFQENIDLSDSDIPNTVITNSVTVNLDKTLGLTEDLTQRTVLSDDDSDPSIQEKTSSSLGRYVDLGLLGKGGMGEVRKVKDRTLNRNLAMKIVHPSILRNKGALSRFIEEAQVGAQLQHPNIVPIHELGVLPDGRYYFTMKEIRGIEFTELIRAVHQASTPQVWKMTPDGTTFRRLIQVFHTMCETMAYAHSLGVLHRDLKPENVMIGGFGEVLVVDWGIAKVLGQIWSDKSVHLWPDVEDFIQTDRSEKEAMATRMGMVAGTPSYMSPEQARGEIHRLSFQSDVYTLGAILYEILSGHPPYSGRTAMEIVDKVRIMKPPSLLTILQTGAREKSFPDSSRLEEADTGKVPLPLIQICERAMEREIKDRYTSAGELAQEIHDWLEGAQKRDKALKEFEIAVEKLSKAIEKESHYEDCWEKTNLVIQKNNFEVSGNWKFWNEGSSAFKEAGQLRREYRRILQGALVYDPELEEANEALADLLLEDIIIALVSGNREKREILEGQFQGYLQYISRRKQEDFNTRLERRRNDNIQLLRAQRGSLVGRQKQCLEITKALKEKSRLISLVGTAGVGKTRLALEIIHDLQEPETQTYFCNLTEADSELGVALSVAKAMNVKLRNIDPVGQLGEIFAKTPTILVLDNLEQVVKDVGKIIVQWMEQSNSLKIIATSRIKLRLEQELSFPIQPLSLLEGMELFAKRGQQADGGFELNEETRNVVGHLVLQLDSLPLAIELAAARLNIFSVEEVAERLKERFSLLRSRTKGGQALQGALDWSWDLLKPWAKAALSQSSVFRGGFDVSAAESVLDCGSWREAPAIFDILQDLSEDSLLLPIKSSEGAIRYGMLESIRQYSRSKLQDEEALGQELSGVKANQETEGRHAKYFSQFGKKDYLDVLDNQGNQQSWGSFFEELDNFIAGTEYGDGEGASLCCMAAMKILGMKGPISLGVSVVEKTLKKEKLSSRQRKQLEILRSRFLRISGRMDEARGARRRRRKQRERVQKPDTKDEEEQATTVLIEAEEKTAPFSEKHRNELRIQAEELVEKGNLENVESFYKEALKYYEQALEIYQKIDLQKEAVSIYEKIAILYQIQGKTEAAFLILNKALELAEKNEFIAQKAMIYNALGTVYLNQSKYSSSLEFYQKSLALHREMNDRLREGALLGNLGGVYYELGQMETAIEYLEQALRINRETGVKRGEGIALGGLGSVYSSMGEKEKAITFYEQAVQILREVGDKKNEGTFLGSLGEIYSNLGEKEKAIKHIKRSLEISIEVGDKRIEGNMTGTLGAIYSDLGDKEKAIKCFKRAIQIAREIKSKRTEGIFLGNVGLVYSSLGEIEKGKKYLEQAVEINREIGNKSNEGINLGNLGEIYLQEKYFEKAKELFLEAIEICQEIKLPIGVGVFNGSLALVYAYQGEESLAFECLENAERLVPIYPLEHGKFLCKKAKVYHLFGQSKRTQVALEKAKKIAIDIRATADSELGKTIAKTEAFLSGKEEQGDENAEIIENTESLRLEAEELLEKGNLEEAEAFYEEALACYNQALEIYQTLKYPKGIVDSLHLIAVVYQHQGNYKKALEELKLAFSIANENEFTSRKARIYASFGAVYFLQAEYEEALKFLHKTLGINRILKNRLEEGNNLGNLGTIYSRIGEHEKSALSHQQSIEIAREIGNKRGEGINLGNLGSVYQHLGIHKKAAKCFQQAIEIAREIGNKRNEGINLGNLGFVYYALGQFEEAIHYYNQSIEITREIGNKRQEGVGLGNLGLVCFHLGQYDEAKNYYQQSLQIAEKIGDKRGEGVNLGNLGDVFLQLEDWESAKEYLERAIGICKRSFSTAAGIFQASLAWVYAKQNNLEDAFSLLEEGEPLVQIEPFEYGKFLCMKARVLFLAKRTDEAKAVLERAEQIADEFGVKENSELQKVIEKTKQFGH